MQVAPGVERVHEFVINCYLVEEAGSLTLVDAGIGATWDLLLAGLEGIGRSLADIEAVLLTHAHVDHIGMADRIRVEAPAPVLIHEADRDSLVAGKRPPNAPDNTVGLSAALRHGFTYRLLWYFARKGALSTPKVAEAGAFVDGQVARRSRPSAGRPCSGTYARIGGAALRGPRRAVHRRRHRHARRGDRQDRAAARAGRVLQRPGRGSWLAGAARRARGRAHPARTRRAVPLARPPVRSPWHARRTAETTPRDGVLTAVMEHRPTDRRSQRPELEPCRPRRAPGSRPR